MKEINYPQLSALSDSGFLRVIEQGSGGAFPALLPYKYEEGSFTATLTGMSDATPPTVTVYYSVMGKIVSLLVEDFVQGTSNANTFTLTGVPSSITPQANAGIAACLVFDNGANAAGFISVLSTGIIQFGKGTSTSGFTASGNKGVIRFVYTYYLR